MTYPSGEPTQTTSICSNKLSSSKLSPVDFPCFFNAGAITTPTYFLACGDAPGPTTMRPWSKRTGPVGSGNIQSMRAPCLQISRSRATDSSIMSLRELKARPSESRMRGLRRSRARSAIAHVHLFADSQRSFSLECSMCSMMRADVVAFHVWSLRSASNGFVSVPSQLSVLTH